MRKALSIIIVLALSSCNNKGKQPIQSTELSSYKTYTLEGCEYIVVGNGNLGTHKGNCKNPIHNRVR